MLKLTEVINKSAQLVRVPLNLFSAVILSVLKIRFGNLFSNHLTTVGTVLGIFGSVFGVVTWYIGYEPDAVTNDQIYSQIQELKENDRQSEAGVFWYEGNWTIDAVKTFDNLNDKYKLSLELIDRSVLFEALSGFSDMVDLQQLKNLQTNREVVISFINELKPEARITKNYAYGISKFTSFSTVQPSSGNCELGKYCSEFVSYRSGGGGAVIQISDNLIAVGDAKLTLEYMKGTEVKKETVDHVTTMHNSFNGVYAVGVLFLYSYQNECLLRPERESKKYIPLNIYMKKV